MNFVSTRIITDDIKRLVSFYERITGTPLTVFTEDFAELNTPSATLAIGSTRTLRLFGGDVARAADNHTAIIEFLVDDVDAEFQKLAAFIKSSLVQEPTTMPWGNRSLLFRDPDGNLVNFFTPVTPDAIKKFKNDSENLRTVKAFFMALERRDKDALPPLLAPDVEEVIPLSNTGAPEPFYEFKRQEQVLSYLGQIFENFSRTVLVDMQFYVADGSTVFVEGRGDLVHASTSQPYRNVYIFKFVLNAGKIVHISEYANPVTYAKLVGMPLG